MIWDIINCFGRFIVTVFATIIVTALREELNSAERAGLGLAGSGSFLTIGVIWEGPDSPFDGWATSLLTFGLAIFLAGYGSRKLRHWRRSSEQVRQSREYLKSRGKL